VPELRVGQRYHPAVGRWPAGLHVLGLSAERLEIMLALDAPSPDEIEAFRRSPLEVGLCRPEGLLVLLLRIRGILDWTDAPFDIRLCPPQERSPLPVGQLAPIWLLVDAQTGVLQALRLTSLSSRLCDELRAVIDEQRARPLDRQAEARAVARYQAGPDSAALAAGAPLLEVAGVNDPPDTPQAQVAAEFAAELGELSGQVPDARLREVMAGAMARGEASLQRVDGELVYVDTEYDAPIPLRHLRYDEALGLVDGRRYPGPGQA
jgi:hypothetical protein